MQAYFLSSDLMFASRVQAAAAQAGVTLAVRGASAHLEDAADARLVIVDLSAADTLGELVSRLRKQCPIAKMVAYAPHVHKNVLEQAGDAGFDQVLTRGQFNERLAQLFAEVAG